MFSNYSRSLELKKFTLKPIEQSKENSSIENNIISVSQLTNTIKNLLEDGIGVTMVQGEISNYKLHSSGHRYFTLKDDAAQISCTMWKHKTVNFQPSDGMKIIVTGILTVYPPRGQYQLECESIKPLGQGDLYLAFEALKKKLEEKGYFDLYRKRLLPAMPMAIGVTTSPTGAAVKDIISTLNRRFPACKIYFRPTLVQGDGSAEDIVAAIKELQQTPAELIIVGRGGGSLEDLWSYNTESVADAIFNSNKPIISAVGHETDFTIADFVADIRAATPTAAAELASPRTLDEFIFLIDNYSNNLYKYTKRNISQFRSQIDNMIGLNISKRILSQLKIHTRQIDELEMRSTNYINKIIRVYKQKVNDVDAHCKSLNPIAPLKKGFALIQANGMIIKQNDSLSSIKDIEIIRENDTIYAKIHKILPPKLFNIEVKHGKQ